MAQTYNYLQKDKTTGKFKSYIQNKDCGVCGTNFKPRNTVTKHCSRNCFFKSVTKNKTKDCIICNRNFYAKSIATRFCSQKCYTKSGIRQKSGSDNVFWKGGITPENLLIRTSSRYLNWVKQILKRDGYLCQDCNEIGNKLHVHHIKTFSSILHDLRKKQGKDNLYDKAMNYFPLWDIDNGITLCIDCHKKTDTYLKNPKKNICKLTT